MTCQWMELIKMGLRRAAQACAEQSGCARMDPDAIPVPLVELNVSGVVTHWNAAATALLGWRSDQMIGRRALEVFGRELLGPNLPTGRQRVRLSHVRGTLIEADIAMTGNTGWTSDGGRCVVAILPDAVAAPGNSSSVCPVVEPWATVAQQIQTIGGDVFCVGIGIVGVEAINKGYSRSTGDAVLAEILRRLLGFAGERGQASRIGGNQFVLTIPGHESPRLDLERMIGALGAPIDCPLGSVRVGVACGVASGPSQSRARAARSGQPLD